MFILFFHRRPMCRPSVWDDGQGAFLELPPGHISSISCLVMGFLPCFIQYGGPHCGSTAVYIGRTPHGILPLFPQYISYYFPITGYLAKGKEIVPPGVHNTACATLTLRQHFIGIEMYPEKLVLTPSLHNFLPVFTVKDGSGCRFLFLVYVELGGQTSFQG